MAKDSGSPTVGERVRALRGRLWWLVVRLIQRLLAGSRGEVTALEQALRVQERLVILALVLASVVPALVLLGYFAFTTSDPVSYESDARQRAERAADDLYNEVNGPFQAFENELDRRLRAGPSPLLRPEQLHPQLRVALQFDDQGNLIAPFAEPASGLRALMQRLKDALDPAGIFNPGRMYEWL